MSRKNTQYVNTNFIYLSHHYHYLFSRIVTTVEKFFYSPRRMLEAGGVTNELRGLEGVTGKDALPAEGQGRSARSVSLPRLLDGRLSF